VRKQFRDEGMLAYSPSDIGYDTLQENRRGRCGWRLPAASLGEESVAALACPLFTSDELEAGLWNCGHTSYSNPPSA
jgi:hypothetical protein